MGEEPSAEERRLRADARREANWKRWGPYLAERQWGTVREDYSHDSDSWADLPHDHARSRAYRWGEDGLLGICDRRGRLCFALALWNERDPFLKERLFGLTNAEGNHGEDVKELYYYLDATPTFSYTRALYKYPQAEFPYEALVRGNAARGRGEPELEILDTGVFDGGRYFDVTVETAKAGPDDVLLRVTIENRGPEAAPLHVLPTVWFRNTWAWGRSGEGYWPEPSITATGDGLRCTHASSIRTMFLLAETPGEALFTDNETNAERLFGTPSRSAYTKDAFHRRVVDGELDATSPEAAGTKAAFWHRLEVPAGGAATLRLRLVSEAERPARPFAAFDAVMGTRRREADAFHAARGPAGLDADQALVRRQALAGLLFGNQFYHYVVDHWLEGDPASPTPPPQRLAGRNAQWRHVFNFDVVSVPDRWEYPWFAAWDLAFHMIPYAELDPDFAKRQLLLFLREWYMHPSGQLPAYEFDFSDVNPPVHAWAVLHVYRQCGRRDARWLARCFQKLLLNYGWWINRKDLDGNNLFGGGFLGLDNIGVFDRSHPLPTGGHLDQADGTAWMAFFCLTMLTIALELSARDPVYEDMASRFFEHFVLIVDALNRHGGAGLWDERDGFYYDHLHVDGASVPLRTRSLVGLVPLFAVGVLEERLVERLPGFRKRLEWFVRNRDDLRETISLLEVDGDGGRLLALPSRARLERVLRYVLDEDEFLSPFGVRSLSKVHEERPYVFRSPGGEHHVAYSPAESTSSMFGGNSNWRGPIWWPLNYLLIESLGHYHAFYGDRLRVELPTGSGRRVPLDVVARDLARRLCGLFLPGAEGARPAHGDQAQYRDDPCFRDLVLFYEYFHGDSGRGCGASHQTGWTALVATCLRLAVSPP